MKTYPTLEHQRAAEKFVEIFSKDKNIMAILLTCSCARGKASKDSCLDIALFIKNIRDKNKYDRRSKKLISKFKEFADLKKVGKYSHVDLDITDGIITPAQRSWTSGPDEFELAIGNLYGYSVVLFERDNYFKKLKKKYFPYYNSQLRKKRLNESIKFCLNNINHIRPYVERELYFQSFDRLYKASKEFMQALFIKNKIYPIAYDKWIKEQFVEILKRPDLYEKMVHLLEIEKLESEELIEKAEVLRKLVNEELK